MKFCFYSGFNQMLQEKGLEATAAWAQEKGFSAVEFLQLPIENWYKGVETPQQARQARCILRNYGLDTACYSVGVNLLDQNALSFLKRQAELAAELHSPFLHHTLIDSLILPQNAPSLFEVLPEILDKASEIARYCQTLGLTCLYEEQGLYFNGIQNFGLFYQEIQKRCPNVGVCGDFGNILFVDEPPLPFFKAFQKEIKHVHIKDYVRASLPPSEEEGWNKTKNGNYLKDVPLGQGIVDSAACIQALREANYQGVFSLELISPTETYANAMALCKQLFK